jgi:mono/diheme cytochrome c family protein
MPPFVRWLAFVAAALAVAVRAAADDPALEAGKRIYASGQLPSGQPLTARVQGDTAATGMQLVCAGCHGRSGLGAGEGQVFTPAITGNVLYKPVEIRRAQLYGIRTLRPAYTDATLARAIRAGIDAAGRPLDPMMPRYALDDGDMQALIAYLKSLSTEPSPGVSDTDIHFATIVTDGVDPRRRKAVLDVLHAFVDDKNAQTRHETSRAARGPFHMARHNQAYRRWDLHVWDLSGAPDTWTAQIEALYARQPVFAVIGGVGDGSWRPIHDFCARRRVPCLLPNTALPVVAASDTQADYYSLYFSKGLTLEAQIVARHLRDAEAPVIQVYRPDEGGMTAASALRQALAPGYPLRDKPLATGERVTAASLRALARANPGARFVLWLDARDMPALEGMADEADHVAHIYLSAALVGQRPPSVPPALRDKVYLVDFFDAPMDAARRLHAVRRWLRTKRIEAADEHLQANTLFALTLVAQALKHVGTNFQRDYFLERVEHIFDSMVTPAAYPKLALGPNQRFAAKGAYLVRLRGSGDAPDRGVWIVP